MTDAAWITRSAQVTGWVGDQDIAIHIDVDASHGWRLNGMDIPGFQGCLDLDLNFSPSTNLLPVRRLGLAIGQEQVVHATWLRFPTFTLEPLEQRYRRMDEAICRYETGSFVRDLRVSQEGFVLDYPDFWKAEAFRFSED